LFKGDELDMTIKGNLQMTGGWNSNINQFRGDWLDITDWEAIEFRALSFRGGELDITVNEKVRLGYLSVQRCLTGHNRLRSHQTQNFIIQRWQTGHNDKRKVNSVLGTRLFRGDKLDVID